MAKAKEQPGIIVDMSKDDIKSSLSDNRRYYLAKNEKTATSLDNFHALALTVRQRIVDRWMKTQERYHQTNGRRVYYLSMEFLIGRLMGNYMFNLGKEKDIEAALREMDINLDDVRDQEIDAGLGNGGLGRLAACFLDSMATLGIPAHGYGIRYDYGIFNQKIKDGNQVELPDEWMRNGNPWEIPRPEYEVKVNFYGRIDPEAQFGCRWVDTEAVVAMPYDIPIPGYKNDVVNTLRLWSARATDEFEFDYFNHGDYEKAVENKIHSESISKVLYPNDNVSQGKELRLKQEYFFTAASIADILRRYKADNNDIRKLHEKICIQLNDTHPTLAVLELMRVLIDQEGLSWEEAWPVTQQTFAYTNHTLMPEALECWAVELLGRVLPRHLEIVFELNRRFLDEVSRKFPGDAERMGRMSCIQEGDQKRVRMAHVAIVGSFSTNGVSALHTELLKAQLFRDFYEMYPERFNNKTNGITPRRWLLKANPKMADLLNETIGDKWVTDLSQLERIAEYQDNKEFQRRWRAIKQANKNHLADYILKTMDISVNRSSLFDVQVKRIHEYKRQFLFGLYIFSQYLKVKNSPHVFMQPRTFIIGGKAAPGYHLAKLIIKFLNNVSVIMNEDKQAREKIRLLFLENYRVSLAEKIIPAADLSEQISTAGMEASGTGNMKFMLNGALTIGTYDGANIEMAEELKHENIFIFGLKANEVQAKRAAGYNPREVIKQSPVLRETFRLLENDFFSPGQPGLFDPLINTIYNGDYFMLCADFEDYCRTQDKVSQLYQNQDEWTRQSILNVSKAGFFSSDRTIREYAKDIWKIKV
ncbi:MAG: glycogen/starch/alpha-glucan phosphorylase [Candidatus Omnitrophica bacterium]|nr:glycogen/starch/alpha-glucan phosphorylase [Candidatus Omnitrophota bacterium]